MGKKYIVEIGRLERLYKAYTNGNGKPNLTWLSPEVDLTPYTAPDLEQVRKEAYEQGRKDGIKDGKCEAWEVAKKIEILREAEMFEIFGEYDMFHIMRRYTASEAIEKLKAYEQEKEEQITKGDIVLIKSTPEVEILVTYADEEYVSGIALTEVDGNCEIGDQYTNIRISNVEKTGKHYDIVSVLQKMKEADNG